MTPRTFTNPGPSMSVASAMRRATTGWVSDGKPLLSHCC